MVIKSHALRLPHPGLRQPPDGRPSDCSISRRERLATRVRTTPRLSFRAVIRAKDEAAIFIDGPNNTAGSNTIGGNFVGTDPSGTRDLGSRIGVLVGESGNTVGGTLPGARNIISGNDDGLSISGGESNNKVTGNYIGRTRSGTGDLGNTNLGVSITGGSDNQVGGASRAEANTVAFNGDTANEAG